MNERVIGVLGGMGPEATLAFYARLIENTPARKDQDHVRVIINSNPKVPDRTAALLWGGESPVSLMTSGIEALERAGADFVVIPCVSAHAFLGELRQCVRIPLLSIFDAAAEQVRQDLPSLRRVGLLATTGTVTSGLFQRRLAELGLDVIVPEEQDQARLMTAIYEIKASGAKDGRVRVSAEVRGVAERVVAAGADGIVLGCTELPLALGPGDVNVPVIDSLVSLASSPWRKSAGIRRTLHPVWASSLRSPNMRDIRALRLIARRAHRSSRCCGRLSPRTASAALRMAGREPRDQPAIAGEAHQ